MAYRAQILGVLCAPIATVLFFIALYNLAGFLPLPPPALSAREITALYLGNATGVRLGAIVLLFCMSFLCAFYATISAQMRRMEGVAPTYTFVQLACGVYALVAFLLGIIAFAVAAFRPERSPEVIQAFSDFAFLCIVMPAAPAFVQLFAIGLAILADKSSRPVYPRWVAYLNFWTAILFLPGLVVCMFLRGPFAWNGLLGFWVPAAVFGLWNNLMAYVMYKAARQQRVAEMSAAPTWNPSDRDTLMSGNRDAAIR
jgi:hypothetical protein